MTSTSKPGGLYGVGLLAVPDPQLRKKSKPVKEIDDSIKKLAERMRSLLAPIGAAGLAAPQLGELVRVIVVKVDQMTTLTIVNPAVVKERGEHFVVEGCKSIPGKQYKLKRPQIVKVTGLDLDGKPITVKGRDSLAQVLKHEVDHLDGILIDSIGKEVEHEMS